MDESVLQLAKIVLIFLFLVWLVHRIEMRAAKDAIFKNFPFFKDSVNSFQEKMNFFSARIASLEERMKGVENKFKS